MNTNFFQAFKSKPFLNLWLGEVFTQIAVNLFNFYLIVFVFNLTQSSTAVSAIVVSFTVPAILFGILAGAYVDRWDKKKVLLFTNISRALIIFILAFFHMNIWMLFLASFLVSLITQFFIPAESPMIPQLVRKDHLLSANALFGLGIFGSVLFAYVISGPLLLQFKAMGSLLILAGLLVVGAVCISFIKEKYSDEDHDIRHTHQLTFHNEVRHAFNIIARTKAIYESLVILAMTQVLTLVIATLIPGYAEKVLGMAVEEFSFLFITPAALGTVIGAVVIVNMLSRFMKEKLVTFGIFLFGVSMLILPYGSRIASRDIVSTLNSFLPPYMDITNLHILVFLAFFMGLANALVFVPSNTLLQERTSDEVRGKAYGVLNTLVGILSFGPILLAGGLADQFGVAAVIIGIGVTVLLSGLYRVVMGHN